jgi:hypothetical protein
MQAICHRGNSAHFRDLSQRLGHGRARMVRMRGNGSSMWCEESWKGSRSSSTTHWQGGLRQAGRVRVRDA